MQKSELSDASYISKHDVAAVLNVMPMLIILLLTTAPLARHHDAGVVQEHLIALFVKQFKKQEIGPVLIHYAYILMKIMGMHGLHRLQELSALQTFMSPKSLIQWKLQSFWGIYPNTNNAENAQNVLRNLEISVF
ncbi:hypothetical protein SS50377_21634 [Spironucleus salmonicida]|uniref:Uncharacterized protein n=1 Tax=Spironucleus salmonicida TaxID=348837 RepID=A0A9P8LXL6_9EUKA|nr:hypothetical protein SS50377_21634 [Spironucleus salmonicida]